MHMRQIGPGWLLVVLLMVSGRPASAQELPAVYEMIPGNAQLAFVINDLDQLNRNMRMLNAKMQLDNPGLNDVLDEFRRTSGMNKGINDNGGMIISIVDIAGMTETNQPQALMLVPISDYADFVGNFGGNARAPITSLQMGWGQTVHCKQSGDYAVLSSARALVDQYRAGSGRIRVDSTNGTIAAEHLAAGDMAIVLDSRNSGKALMTLLDQMMEMIDQSESEFMPQLKPIMDELVKTIGGLARAGLEKLTQDTELAGVSMDLTPDGIGLTAVARLKTGAGLSKLFTGAKGASTGLAHFPPAPYLTASTVNLQGIKIKEITTQLQSTLKANGMDATAMKMEGLGALLDKVKTVSRVTFAPEQLNFTAQLNEALLIEATDGRAFAAAFRNYVDSLNGTEMEIGQLPGPSGRVDPEQPPAVIRLTTRYESRVQLIEGINVDQYVVERNFPPQFSAAMGRLFGWIMLFSSREQKGYVAVVDDMVVVTATDDLQLIRKMVLGVSQTGGLGSKVLFKQTQRHLPSNSAYQWYLSVNDIANMFDQGVKAMEADFDKIGLRDPLPPIAMGIAADSKGVAKRLFIPMEVLRAGREPVMMIFDAMFGEEEPEPTRADGRGPAGPGGRGMMPGGGRGGDRPPTPGGGPGPGMIPPTPGRL